MESGFGNGDGVRRASLIREVNERIREISGRLDSFEVRCECGRHDCDRTVELTGARWEEIRRAERAFVVAPGHEPAGCGPLEREVGAYRVAVP